MSFIHEDNAPVNPEWGWARRIALHWLPLRRKGRGISCVNPKRNILPAISSFGAVPHDCRSKDPQCHRHNHRDSGSNISRPNHIRHPHTHIQVMELPRHGHDDRKKRQSSTATHQEIWAHSHPAKHLGPSSWSWSRMSSSQGMVSLFNL